MNETKHIGSLKIELIAYKAVAAHFTK